MEPEAGAEARDPAFALRSKLDFPKYTPQFTGSGSPVETAFKGIVLADPAEAANCGVVHLSLNRGHIALGEGDSHRCGANRLVFGCILRNAAGVMAEVPNLEQDQPAWLRYTHKFRSAIRVDAAENALVACNRLPQSGDENFTMTDYPLLDRNRRIVPFEVEFDYDNRPGIYLNHHCIGGAGATGNDGTPETHPWGFRQGAVIRDNSRLRNNRGNSYLSLYHVGEIDGLHVEGNDVSTPGRISDIYVCAPRHWQDGARCGMPSRLDRKSILTPTPDERMEEPRDDR